MNLKINLTFLIQLLYLNLAGITAYQKIKGLSVPNWFIKKFEPTFLNAIPYGISVSYIVITFLESAIALLIIISILKKEYQHQQAKIFLTDALQLSLVLFIILFFGSFIAEDYGNGALDFLYFIGTVVLMFILKTQEQKQHAL